MSRYEVWDNRGRIDTPNPSPTLHRLDTVSQNGLLVILVSDVNERDHESFCTGTAEHLCHRLKSRRWLSPIIWGCERAAVHPDVFRSAWKVVPVQTRIFGKLTRRLAPREQVYPKSFSSHSR
jgi:hypothetical protein